MRIGRTNKRVAGQISILLEKFFRCDTEAEFQSLESQILGYESQLGEDAEPGFVYVSRDEDAFHGMYYPLYGSEIDI